MFMLTERVVVCTCLCGPWFLQVEGDKVVGKGVRHVISSKRTREQRTIHKNLRDVVFDVRKSAEEESIRMQNNLAFI
jgi:hypothetical protein